MERPTKKIVVYALRVEKTEINPSVLSLTTVSWVINSDELELEFSSSSRAMKIPSQAELGHFNFRAETELTKKNIFALDS